MNLVVVKKSTAAFCEHLVAFPPNYSSHGFAMRLVITWQGTLKSPGKDSCRCFLTTPYKIPRDTPASKMQEIQGFSARLRGASRRQAGRRARRTLQNGLRRLAVCLPGPQLWRE